MRGMVEELTAAAEWMDSVSQKCCECTDGHHEQTYAFGTEDDVHISRDAARALADWFRSAAYDASQIGADRKAIAAARLILPK